MGSSGSDNNNSRSIGVTDVDLGERGQITVDIPLVYSADSGCPEMPRSVQEFENKRKNSKIEFGMVVTADGTVLEERRGGKGSVKVSISALTNGDYLTHIHPRTGVDVDELGGTFSKEDIDNWARFNVSTYRAVASEGTYSITKSPEMLADRSRALSFTRDFTRLSRDIHTWANEQVAPLTRTYVETARDLRSRCLRGEISREEFRERNNEAYNSYVTQANRIANVGHINRHNWLLENQKKYGYTYGLER